MGALGARHDYFDRMTVPPPSGIAEGEAELVARARGGDVEAFEGLYRASHGRVMALCLRMTGDTRRATELTHDAFVRAWQQLASFRGESAFTTWLHRLTVNVVLADARAEGRRASHQAEDASGDDEKAVPAMSRDIVSRIDLERAIARLPTNARLVFVLHDVEGYKHEEIAARMSLATGTVRAHLHRARQLLMRMLAA
jgi:RNA polymerase sigma-70 factor (ECF subfamily)